MGYQVGNICYTDRMQAENAYFSSVSPVIQNGRLVQLQYNGNPKHMDSGWTLNGRRVTADLPQCGPVQNFREGSELGWLIVLIMATLYVFTLIKGQLK